MHKHALAAIFSCLVLSCNAAPTIDGVLDSTGYVRVSPDNAPGLMTGFGTAIDCSQIWYQDDGTNVYFFIQCSADTTNDNGILVLLGTSAQTGAAAGTSLGNVSGAGHCFGNTGNNDWKMDFEVDRGWVGNSGSSAANFWIDSASYVGSPAGSYFGNLGQAGSPVTNGGVTMAFNNGGASGGPGSSSGWEFQITRADLGGVTTTDSFRIWAVVVSSSAYFSDDSATATYTGNPGFNPDFGSGGYALTNENIDGTFPVTVSAFTLE